MCFVLYGYLATSHAVCVASCGVWKADRRALWATRFGAAARARMLGDRPRRAGEP